MSDDGRPCSDDLKTLNNFANSVNNASVPYHLLGPNSNSVTSGGLGALGINDWSPPVIAPGGAPRSHTNDFRGWRSVCDKNAIQARGLAVRPRSPSSPCLCWFIRSRRAPRKDTGCSGGYRSGASTRIRRTDSPSFYRCAPHCVCGIFTRTSPDVREDLSNILRRLLEGTYPDRIRL